MAYPCGLLGDRRNADVARNDLRRVGTEGMGNGEQVGMLRLQSVGRSREASKNLLWSAIVARAGMNQGTKHRITLRYGCMFGKQFADLQARDSGGDRTIRASVF